MDAKKFVSLHDFWNTLPRKERDEVFKKNENKHNLTIWQHNNKMEVHCTTH